MAGINNIEELYKNNFNGFQITPSSGVWNKIHYKLWLRSFLKFKLNQFNIYYLTLITLATCSIPIYSIIHDFSANDDISQSLNLQENNNNTIHSNNLDIDNPEQTNNIINPVDEKVIKENVLPVTHFEVSAKSGCVPLEVHFENASSGASNNVWDLDIKIVKNKDKTSVVYDKPGKYKVTLKSLHDSKWYSYSEIIEVYPRPRANFEIDEKLSNYSQNKLVFKNKSVNGESYKWFFGDGNTSNELNPMNNYKEPGTYNIKQIVYNKYNCSDTYELKSSIVKTECHLVFPKEFYPQAGIGEEKLQKMFVPVSKGIADYYMKVYDPATMLLIFETNDVNKAWTGYLDGKLLPKGQYNWEAFGRYINGERFSMDGEVFLITKEKVDYDQY
ncbi:MAG: PKD domain-containing protein [bacterium]